MNRHTFVTAGCAALSFVLIGTGCVSAGSSAATRAASTAVLAVAPETWPPLGAAKSVAPGVLVREATLPQRRRTGDAPPMKVWVYLPERLAGPKIPCVLIAPAGSPLIHGMALGPGDRAEHLPWVRAGFAVVAYELDGAVGENAGDDETMRAVRAFVAASGGLDNARTALDYAQAKVPQIDPARVYTAGHSSAATVALLVAAREPRIKACVAFAPATDLESDEELGKQAITTLDGVVPGFADWVRRTSPFTNAPRLRCPLFLFHADDDSTVSVNESARFAEAVRRTNPDVIFRRVQTGGHYESMIRQGIPLAVGWLKEQAAAVAAPRPTVPSKNR